MSRHYVIAHPVLDEYLRGFTPGRQRWVSDDHEAMRFADERAAWLANDALLEGAGRLVEVVDVSGGADAR